VRSNDDSKFMRLALAIAARGQGLTTPNPMVGAVIVKRGQVISQGYHRRAGGRHAEIEALVKAGSQARGATLYVTLEPCCHIGRTGPCTDKIISAGIRRVVLANTDPDPRVRGRGARVLRDAGIRITSGVLADEARMLNEAHYHFHTTHRPFVTVKFAQSLDGRVATATGDSRWISGPGALDYAHQLRAQSCAVAVGSGTVIADNPALTVRRVHGAQPFRVILSSSLEFGSDRKLVKEPVRFPTIVVTTRSAVRRVAKARWARNVMFLEVKSAGRGKLDLREFLRKMASFNIKSILVEGGPTLITSFLKAGLSDKVIIITSPILAGRGIESIGDLGIKRISDSLKLDRVRLQAIGRDFVFTGYPKKRRS
jgi:diaminohydroxyphosphoribosylaminopyrimidine deaminase/5-amino-6-(5-phosphoribosylamino)uracil reductase